MSFLLVAQRALTVPGWVKNALWRAAKATPSLDLPFADSKSLVDAITGRQLISYARAGSGTYVDSAGVLSTAVTNLVPGSADFSATYTALGNVTVSSDATVAPDGSLTADSVAGTNSTLNIKNWYKNFATNSIGTYTASVYLKANTQSIVLIRINDNTGSNGARQLINLSTGALLGGVATDGTATGASSTISNAGNGWYRCTVTCTFNSAITSLQGPSVLHDGYTTSTSTNNYFAWGAQLEQSSTVGEYIPTGSTINSAPRFDHNPLTGESLGLLVEEQRTNLALYSQAINVANWGLAQATTQTLNAATSPDGSSNATLLIENTQNANRFIGQTIAVTNAAYTVSIFAKAKERRRIMFRESSVSGTSATFDLQSGTVVGSEGSPVTSIQPYGNGWYRCVMTYTPSSASTRVHSVYLMPDSGTSFATSTYTGDGTSGLFLFGFHVEAGATASSYIPTTTAAATRNASLADLISSAIANNIRSFYVEFSSPAVGTRGAVSLNDNTANERIEVITSGTDPRLVVHDGGVEQANINGGTVTAGVKTRVAVRINTNNFAISINGSTAVTDTSGTLPTVDRLMIGRTQAGEYLNGRIARFAGWTELLSDVTLQAITQP